MEVVRRIIDSNLLDKINLPDSLKNRKVEVTILPFDELTLLSDISYDDGNTAEDEIHNIMDLVGIANKYAKRGMSIDEVMEQESQIWAEMVVNKYEQNNS